MNPVETSVFAETSKSQVHFLRIGGVSLEFKSEDLLLTLPVGLRGFTAQPATPDISIVVEWVHELTPSREGTAFDSGCTWKVHDLGPYLQFDFYVGSAKDMPYKRLVTDRRFTSAKLQMSRRVSESVGFDPVALDYPLDELLIMHRLTQEKAVELHGSGIVTAEGVGNLFVGHSGAGKSTTTRLWTECEDVEVLSDDRIIVRRDHPRPVRRNEAGILRPRDRSASPSGRSAQDDNTGKMRMYGTPWHGEAMYASPGSAPLARIFILEHGQGNVLTRLAPNQAVAELFARSFVPFHRHEYVESALEFLQEVVDMVPCYRYGFEPNRNAVETILHLHE